MGNEKITYKSSDKEICNELECTPRFGSIKEIKEPFESCLKGGWIIKLSKLNKLSGTGIKIQRLYGSNTNFSSRGKALAWLTVQWCETHKSMEGSHLGIFQIRFGAFLKKVSY